MVSDANSGYSTWRRWLQDVFPASESPKPKLIPEIEPTFLSEGDSWARSCFKSEENHPRYIPITDLQLHQLPDGWRHQQVLSDVQAVGRRVVKLTVKKRSSARAGEPRPGGHVGTGFVTFHPRWGAVVHTCKHVVFDCFEADNTMVTFFYDKEVSGGKPVLKCPGSSRHFRSVWSMDYSSFALALPMQEFFPLTDDRVDDRFAWRNFSLSRLLYRQKSTVDVLIISHPHGRPKQVSFGKLTRRHSMVPVMYDAPTCPGSSGAPVVRLSADHAIYLTAGQFLHHGHYHSRVSLGMGQLRPPLTLPYWRPLDNPRLRRVVSTLYEPVSYWALMVVNMLEVESVLFNGIDNLCYFLTLYGFFFGWRDAWVWCVLAVLLTMLAFQMCRYAYSGGHWRYAVTHLALVAYSLSMHWVTWLVINVVPEDYLALWWVAPFWLSVLMVSRHVHLPPHFFDTHLECRL